MAVASAIRILGQREAAFPIHEVPARRWIWASGA
jgi:hypothetical protein